MTIVFCEITSAVARFEKLDPNYSQFLKINRRINSMLTCHTEIHEEKKCSLPSRLLNVWEACSFHIYKLSPKYCLQCARIILGLKCKWNCVIVSVSFLYFQWIFGLHMTSRNGKNAKVGEHLHIIFKWKYKVGKYLQITVSYRLSFFVSVMVMWMLWYHRKTLLFLIHLVIIVFMSRNMKLVKTSNSKVLIASSTKLSWNLLFYRHASVKFAFEMFLYQKLYYIVYSININLVI